MRSIFRILSSTISTALLAVALLGGLARAHGNYLTTWNTAYPNSLADDYVVYSTGSSCQLCHFTSTGGQNWNAYGWKMHQNIQAGQSLSTAIANSASFNSDNDPTGSTNAVEIAANAQPGWTPGNVNTRYNQSSTVANQPPPAGFQGFLDPQPCGTALTFCTSGTTSNGCLATMAMSGSPTASHSGVCTISVNNVEGQQSGLIFYGLGRGATLWGSGPSFMCVKTPTERTPPQSTGGTSGQCNGQLAVDINAFWAANPAVLGQPITAGQVFDFQGWFRDPPTTKTTSLSNGLEVTICP